MQTIAITVTDDFPNVIGGYKGSTLIVTVERAIANAPTAIEQWVRLIATSPEFIKWYDEVRNSGTGLKYATTIFNTAARNEDGSFFGYVLSAARERIVEFFEWVKDQPEPREEGTTSDEIDALADWERELLGLPTETRQRPASEWVIGDRVRAIVDHPGDYLAEGDAGTITSEPVLSMGGGAGVYYLSVKLDKHGDTRGSVGTYSKYLELLPAVAPASAEPEPRFKVGDRVRRLPGTGNDRISGTVTVSEVVRSLVDPDWGQYYLKFEENDFSLWENFAELAIDNKEEIVTGIVLANLKEGDQLRMVRPISEGHRVVWWNEHLNPGDVVTVGPELDYAKPQTDSSDNLYGLSDRYLREGPFDTGAFELVAPAPAQEDGEAERVARALGANAAQLGKLRAIVEARKAAEAEAERLRAELAQRPSTGSDEQITDGSDPRLREFWAKAAEAANEAGYCNEYDRMAAALNGPGRTKSGHVHVDVTLGSLELTIDEVEVDNINDDPDLDAVFEALIEMVYEMDRDQLRDLFRNSIDSTDVSERCED